jgi:hypothetical protein
MQSAHETEPPSSITCRIAATGRRSPPLTAVRHRLPLPACLRASAAARSRSDGPDQFDHRNLRSCRRQPLDRDPTGWIRSNPSQYWSNRLDSAFLQKTPLRFLDFTKIPSRSSKFLQLGPFATFRPRIFRFLYSLVLTPSLVRILVVLAPFLAFFISTRSSRSVK